MIYSSSIQNRDAVCAIGLDIGGTKIAGGLVTPNGTVLQKRVVPTLPARGGAAVLEDALGMAQALHTEAKSLNGRVAAIGICICELVDLQGRILSAATVDWRDLPVQKRFDDLAPSLIEADSRAAAYAEASCGAGKPFRTFFYAAVGTGIGSSWVIDGKPHAGANGCTGTLASSPTTILCSECGTLRRAILEEIASGTALVTRYNQQSKGKVTSAEEVLRAAELGEPAADWVVNTAVESFGATLGLIVNVLDPEALIVGGGLGSAPGLFWDRLRPAVRQHIWSDIHRELPILQAFQRGDSGLIGAALLAWKRLGQD